MRTLYKEVFVIFNHPGIKVPDIHDKLLLNNPPITVDKIRNSIKKIYKYVEYKGSRKTRGYY